MKMYARCGGISSLIIFVTVIMSTNAYMTGMSANCQMGILIPINAKMNETHESTFFDCEDQPQMVIHWCNLFTYRHTAYYRTIIDHPTKKITTNWTLCTKVDNSLMIYHIVYAGFCVALICLGVYPCLFSTKSKWQCKREEVAATMVQLDRERDMERERNVAGDCLQLQVPVPPKIPALQAPNTSVPNIKFTLNDIEQQRR